MCARHSCDASQADWCCSEKLPATSLTRRVGTLGPVTVVVVGAGPVGVTAALLLARRGIDVLVLDRHRAAHPQPRAVHLDDEALRVLQAAGVADAFTAISA